MVWWALLALQAGFQLLSGLLSKAAKPKPEVQPKLPTNDGAKSIPVIYGRCLITDPFIMDYLDFRIEPIKKRNPATFFLTSVTIGYRYYLGIIFGFCYATGDHLSDNNPSIISIFIDDQEVFFDPIPGVTVSGHRDIDIHKPSLFGSSEREGGVAARLTFYDGSDPNGFAGNFKESDPYWEGQRGLTLPHYKNLSYAVWQGPSNGVVFSSGRKSGYIGNSTSLWPISFLLRRIPDQLAVSSSTINGHANAVYCLYELLTNTHYGAGIPTSKFYLLEWQGAAFLAFSNDLEFSYLWNTASPIEDMVGEMLRHVAGVIWTDLQTGLIRIQVLRQESAEGLPQYDNNDFTEISSFSRGSWEDTVNEIKIVYPDYSKTNFENSTLTYFEAANFALQGVTKTETITYNGCPTAALASRLAAREARLLCHPYARLTAKIDRKGWLLVPGSRFKFSWPEHGITDLVMRITSIKLGTITDGLIEISAIEDVFAVGEPTFGAPASTIWTDPLAGSALNATAAVGEVPYFYQQSDLIYIFSVAARPNTAHVAYDGAINDVVELSEIDFTPRGVLSAFLPQLTNGDYDTTGFSVQSVVDQDVVEAGTATTIAGEAASLAIIGDPSGTHEWIAFESVSGTGTKFLDNVWRGLLDTPPRSWPANTPIWFFSVGAGMYPLTLASSTIYNLNVLPFTMRDQLALGSATDYGYTTTQRALRPLPPYYVLFDGSYTNEIWTSGDIDLTWREHSRLAMTQVLKQSVADESPESGVTYEVDVRGESGTVEATYTGIATPSFTYTAADQITDFGVAQGILTFDIYSSRDGLRSSYPWSRNVYGFDGGGNFVVNDGDFVTNDGDFVVDN